jgi:hypothetical protein
VAILSARTLAARIADADFSNRRRKDGSIGRPLCIVLQNTSDPTIELWLSWPPEKRSGYIPNAQSFHETISIGRQGHISSCRQLAASVRYAIPIRLEIEMIGEFNLEAFDQGPGALVWANVIYLMAFLHNKLGLEPEPYVYGRQGLHFHIECKKDNHDCAGKFVTKPEVVARISAKITELRAFSVATTLAGSDQLSSDPRLCINIVATVFGGGDDPNTSAYDNQVIDDHLGVALPLRFKDPRPKVRLTKGGKSARPISLSTSVGAGGL